MRATLAGLLVVVVACGAETSTPQEPVANATPSTLATTTPVAATTTTSEQEEECQGADRGVLCPPDHPQMEGLNAFLSPRFRVAAGTWRTRFFRPAFEWTTTQQYETQGQGAEGVNLVARGCRINIRGSGTGPCDWIWVFGSLVTAEWDALREEDLRGEEAAECVEMEETTLWGRPARLMDARDPIRGAEDFVCPAFIPVFMHLHQTWPRLIFRVEVEGESLLVYVTASSDFDRFLEEEAQPILDSVRFLDD